MASDVEVVNYALTLLGEDAITALTDSNVRALAANRIYGPVRDSVLRSHPWNCATVLSTVASLGTAPAHTWAYQYQLPTSPHCLRLLALNDVEADGDSGDYFKVAGRKIYTDESTANLRYIGRITDPNDYDALLYEALAHRLASRLAYALTGQVSLAGDMIRLYEYVLKEARTVDGQEGSPDSFNSTTLTDVRL